MTEVSRRPGSRGPLPQDHRERLLDGMASAVRAAGFQRCTVADVARAAGASRRTFYAHFKDLDECYLALFARFAEANLGAVAAALDAPGTPRERLAGAVSGYVRVTAADPALASSFFRELPLAGERGLAALRAANEHAGRVIHELSAVAAREEPETGVRVVPVPMARMLVAGIVQMALMTREEGGDPEELQAAATDLVATVVLGSRDLGQWSQQGSNL